MAAPMVAGLLGLMKSLNPALTNEQLIQCLLTSADSIDSQNSAYAGQLGAGRINAYEAMKCVAATLVNTSNSWSTYYNPSTNTLELTNDSSWEKGTQFEVYNELGQRITRIVVAEESTTQLLPVPVIATGIYFVQMKNSTTTSVLKIFL